MPLLKEKPTWQSAKFTGSAIGVDREHEIIRAFIGAQEGPFKSEGRGELEVKGLHDIVRLMRQSPNGLKSRFTHPSLSSDGLGKFLGRARNPRIDTITVRESQGELRTNRIKVVRGDLHISPSSHDTPDGDIGAYILNLAEEDSDALSSSLVLTIEEEWRLDRKGRPKTDADGNELPPLWRPKRLHASDIVDRGDAVDGFLSTAVSLPDMAVRQGAALLDRQFGGQPDRVIRARANAWLDPYLEQRGGGVFDGDLSKRLRKAREAMAQDAAAR